MQLHPALPRWAEKAAVPGYDLVTGVGVLNGVYAGPPWNLP
jgi:hypothetical protein